MNISIGQKALVTVDNWFFAPDGRQYRAVFGTVKGVHTAEDTLGVRPNGRSTNWYLEIGCVTLAGCQVHYAVRCDSFSLEAAGDFSIHEGELKEFKRPCSIFDADAEGA